MCTTCGCGQDEVAIKASPFAKNENDHEHTHHHHGDHHHHGLEKIDIEKNILQKNDLIAERNRGFLDAKNIVAFNLVSSPGSGKTSVLEKIIKGFTPKHPVYVIEGDQQTSLDAARIEKTGATAIQVNTGKGCHLDAEMVNKAIKALNPKNEAFLFIENVGNLVCPALFDLGEQKRAVIYSITEGDDKPLKYPYIFESSDICIINKTDLLPYVDFDMEKAKKNALMINHHLEFFETSARDGSGIELLVKYMENLFEQLIAK